MKKSNQDPRIVAAPAVARYAPDEPQPESAILERAALSEREDGTIFEGSAARDVPRADTLPIIQLTRDERQPIDAIAEYNAPSEREDGTNTG